MVNSAEPSGDRLHFVSAPIHVSKASEVNSEISELMVESSSSLLCRTSSSSVATLSTSTSLLPITAEGRLSAIVILFTLEAFVDSSGSKSSWNSETSGLPVS